ncbi:hypothetical protein SEPCBS57363_004096 [Sporothrix epigloea]|uniref:U1-type domain-containing protein n=1 Tax=Sporothrix epigloea TaxID=1892477 RepID=A0ABP0DQF2_9PEZI
MADYWKSTPKYWCKHCQVYVSDTKLQRANHETTGKHQSAVRRALRNLHRDHERQERENDEAEREVARINALVDGQSAATGARSGSTVQSRPTRPPPAKQPTQTPQTSLNAHREQLEQLADLGVSIPENFRPELAMAGDWTVTETRIVEVQEDGGDAIKGEATRSIGVRKRPRGNPDDDDDEGRNKQESSYSELEKNELDTAVQGLFKRPRQWGRDLLTAGRSGGSENDGGDLDRLLSSVVAKSAAATKEEEEGDTKRKSSDGVKKEESAPDAKGNAATTASASPKIKTESDLEALASRVEGAGDIGAPAAEPAIMFKKRKAKPGRK